MEIKTIVLTFDYTCVAYSFPGKEEHDIGAVIVLQDLASKGHRLFVNPTSYQANRAQKWFEDNNIPLAGITFNTNDYDIVIDAKALGCPVIYPSSNNWLKPLNVTPRTYVPSDRPYVDWYEVYTYCLKNDIL